MQGVGNTPSSPQVFSGDNLLITGDSGFPALIGVIGNNNQLSGGNVGNDTIWSIGSNVVVSDTTPGNLFGEIGDNDTITGGPGGDTIWTIGNNESIAGGVGNDLFGLLGDNSTIDGGGGNDTVYVSGDHDTVAGGSGNSEVVFGGTNHTLLDNAGVYNDTVVGFEQSAGDRIHLTTDTVADALAHSSQVNGGQDTLITLSDGSTILLKGVAHIDNSFFS